MKLHYLPQRGFTGFVRLWVLTLTDFGPGLLPRLVRRGLHLPEGIMLHLLFAANIVRPRAKNTATILPKFEVNLCAPRLILINLPALQFLQVTIYDRRHQFPWPELLSGFDEYDQNCNT